MRVPVLFGLWNRPPVSLEAEDGYGLYDLYRPKEFADRLALGTLYISFTQNTGGFYSWTWFAEDGLESRIASFVQERPRYWNREDIVSYHVSFLRWGFTWGVTIYAKPPVVESELQEAFSIVQTLAFPNTPVVSENQAIELVVPHVPKSLRPLNSWRECCPWHVFDYDQGLSARREGDRFLVTHDVGEGRWRSDPGPPVAFWVEADGSVSQTEMTTESDR